MRKLVVFMHMSVDGFAAGPDGEMGWIHVDDEIFDYAGDQTDEADVALYGRKTFEMMDAYWPNAADQPGATPHDVKHSRWYNSVDKLVLSHSMQAKEKNKTSFISKDVTEHINRVKNQPGKNIIVFGSPTTVGFLLQENLVDELWLFVNPIILGKGISFFNGAKNSLRLKLVSSNAFSSGVVCLQYSKDK